MADAGVAPIGWERALLATEKVKERLRRAIKALEDAAIPYARPAHIKLVSAIGLP